MPPKKKSRVEHVDGVHCSLNFATGNVIVGTGLVGHDARDQFKLKNGSTLEAQVRARPKFKELLAVAAAKAAIAAQQEPESPSEQPPASEPQVQKPPDSEPKQPSDSEPKQLSRVTCWRHSDRPWAKRQLARRPAPLPLSETILFGDCRRAPSSSYRGAPRALSARLLESDLGKAWQTGWQARAGAEAQLRRVEETQREIQQARWKAADETRKRNREAREAAREPCLCTPAGAAVMMGQSHGLARDLLADLSKANSVIASLSKQLREVKTAQQPAAGKEGVQQCCVLGCEHCVPASVELSDEE